jgi:hypothetical protein
MASLDHEHVPAIASTLIEQIRERTKHFAQQMMSFVVGGT